MAGLLSGAAGAPGAGRTPANPGSPGSQSGAAGQADRPGSRVANDDAQDAANVSPEEQRAYDMFVDQAYSLIYDPKTLPRFVERLTATGDPVEGLANLTAMTVMRVEQAAAEAGEQVGPDVLFHGGAEILEDLASLAKRSGTHDYSDDEMEAATYQALDLYRTMKAGQGGLNEEGLQQDLQQLVALDSQGRLGDVFPELEKKFGKGGHPPAANDNAKPQPGPEQPSGPGRQTAGPNRQQRRAQARRRR